MTATGADRAKTVPGEPGLWVLIGGDLVVFGALFVAYIVALMESPAAFEVAQGTLDRGLGLLNTLILLSSSWCAAQAVTGARIGSRRVRTCLLGTALLGAGFVVVKAFEWSKEILAGHTLNSESFFTFYFMYTGIHLLHVLIGLGFIIWLISRCGRDGAWRGSVNILEGGAVFWHLVDLLWVMIFSLIYLLH